VGENLFRYRVSRGRFHISQGETLFRGRLYFVTPAIKCGLTASWQVKRRLSRLEKFSETLKTMLGLVQNFKHPQLIRYGRPRCTMSVLFCFLYLYFERIQDPFNYRPKHFIDSDTRTGTQTATGVTAVGA